MIAEERVAQLEAELAALRAKDERLEAAVCESMAGASPNTFQISPI